MPLNVAVKAPNGAQPAPELWYASPESLVADAPDPV